MNHVMIKDGVTINQAIVSCGCKIGRGQKVEETELSPKTHLPDKVGYIEESPI